MTVDGRIVGRIGAGLLVFLGIEAKDGPDDVRYMSGKIADLRAFEDPSAADRRSRLNRSVRDVGGAVLLVSQFTICGDCRKGRRPSFDRAAGPTLARSLYDRVTLELRAAGLTVETGEFRAAMKVELVNDGPVTLLLDSHRTF